MNDFHFLAIALANKNKHQAMLLLRDKNEFAARKIMEKAGANVPSLTGRLFWRWVQDYIFSACRPQQETRYETIAKSHRDNKPASDDNARLAESGSHRPDKGNGATGHDGGSLQHAVYERSRSGTVRTGKNGVPSVHNDMGGKHYQSTRQASDKGEPAVGLGGSHPACVRPGISQSFSVVRAQHSVRIRQRNAAAGVAGEICLERYGHRHRITHNIDVSTMACKLWPSGRTAGTGAGSLFRYRDNTTAARTGGCRVVRRAVQPERSEPPGCAAFRNDDGGHITHTAASLVRAAAGRCADAGRPGTLHAPPFLLRSLYLASFSVRYCSAHSRVLKLPACNHTRSVVAAWYLLSEPVIKFGFTQRIKILQSYY